MQYHWNIVGHVPLLEALEHDIASGNLAHAYLFAGPEKVGKYVVAKTLTHILQCPNNYCHDCPTCTQIEKGSHPDVIELADNYESIKIETIREIVDRIQMTTSSPYKIVLIEKIERMSTEAANCLLKNLEEPPAKTLFLFTTMSVRDVLPTIVSRMRVLQFHHCNQEEIRRKIAEEHFGTDAETLDQVTQFAMGKPGIAFRLLRDPEFLSLYRRLYHELLFLIENPRVFEGFCAVQEFVEDPQKREHFLDIFTHLVRMKMIQEPLNRKRFLAILDRLAQVRFSLEHNANTKLALEQLVLAL